MFMLDAISHRYNGEPVLEVPRWQAEQGEHLLVLGPSGSGKSTLLHIMAGLLAPSEGTVTVAERNLQTLAEAERDRFRGRHIGILFQRLHLVSTLTVFDNVRLAPYLAGLPQDRRRIEGVLERLGIGDKRDVYPSALSFGEAQRAALARALVNEPRLILVDEPTSNLDDAHCEQALALLEEQASASRATLVIATHDQRVKERFSKHLQLRGR